MMEWEWTQPPSSILHPPSSPLINTLGDLVFEHPLLHPADGQQKDPRRANRTVQAGRVCRSVGGMGEG